MTNDQTAMASGVATLVMRDQEEWRDVVGYERIYGISDWARVRRIAGGRGARAGRILKQRTDPNGYLYVILCLHGKRTTHRVHHLMANAFLAPKSSTDQVLRHLNDDPADNRIENLAWGTYSDNMADSVRNGTAFVAKGSANYNAKLHDDKVREIRRLYATGEFTLHELGLRFGVSDRTISKIVRRQTWKHIA